MPHAALYLNDRQLLAECSVDTYRASGPGGQKRNKVDSAVRLRHHPTGVIAIAEESRSQVENRRRALRRLRERIAIDVRSPVDLECLKLPPELTQRWENGRLRIHERHADYPLVVATILDVLAASAGRLSDAAAGLTLSTSQLVRLLADHPRVWQGVNQMRRQHGLPALKQP